MQPLKAAEFLPQQAPFLLVDRMLSCEQHLCHTDFPVPMVHPLVKDGVLLEAGVLENIAQSCAAHIGYLSRNIPVRIGVVASIRNLKIHTFPRVGDVVETVVEEQGDPIFSVSIYMAKVMVGDQLVAEGEMRVVLTEQEPTMANAK